RSLHSFPTRRSSDLSYDPYHYRLHKANGGSFQSYQHKTYRPLSDSEIARHLEGGQHIGIYPLLQDNTSWFLVADFDKADWQREADRKSTRLNSSHVK